MEDQIPILNQAQTNQPNSEINNSEMAKKEPLLYKKTVIKIALLVFAILLSIGIVITGIYAYQSVLEAMKPPEIIEQEPEQPSKPVVEKVPVFAYIKDESSIWQVDINGQEKIRLLEIPSGSSEKFTSIAWKSEKEISYSKFDGKTSTIESLNTETKGVLTELNNQPGKIENLSWGGSNYLAYSLTNTDEDEMSFYLKTGTVLSKLSTFLIKPENAALNTRILFVEDDNNLIVSGNRLDLIKETPGKPEIERQTKFIQVFQLNGTKVDQIENASDPMVIDRNKIAFKYEGYLSSKYIGQNDITKITEIDGNNPTVSFDKSQYAFWSSTGGFANALLVIYDTNLNYQRKILRGVLLPEWISSDKVAGIRADNCLGTNCQLYQYQTNNLSIVEVSIGKVIEVDQGRSISSISYNRWHAN